MKYLWLLTLILFLKVGATLPVPSHPNLFDDGVNDFEELMGKNLPSWSYVETKEDQENLRFFKALYDKNFSLMQRGPNDLHIPKVIHFIWVGPKPFPKDSVENVKQWMDKHPAWRVKFWTDHDRELPDPRMEKCFVKDFHFLKLASCYKNSENYGEKSDLLRYEILYQEGGVYVDHDVACIQPFDLFNATYDLYLGMQMPDKTFLSSSVVPTNNLIGAQPGHPVLERCIATIAQKWDTLEKIYPGSDRDSTISRVAHRTFVVLGESMKEVGDQKGYRDIVFPAFYFNAPKGIPALFSRHQFKGTWFENETAFEKSIRERLVKITKKTNKLLLFFGIMTAISILGFSILLYDVRRRTS